MVSRKEFLGASAAFAAAPLFAGQERPLWKAGIITDTHVKRTRESCALVKAACGLFARHRIDVFANCGDIADHYYEEVYPILDEITRAAFPGKKPVRLWVYANHDRLRRGKEPWKKVFSDVKRLLNATNDIYDCIDFKGFPLVTLPQFWTEEKKKTEDFLADVAARYPTGPIFVFDHVPPFDTVDGSITWGNYASHSLYSRYPRVIQLCGHSHSSLRSELNIWQGAFTAVSSGCLSGWSGHAVGRPPEGKRSYGALIMEVYRSKIVFRRFDVRTGREYAADAPWTVPLPFDPAAAPYTRAAAARREKVPQYRKGAKPTLSADVPFTALTLRIPRTVNGNGAYKHRVQVLSSDGRQMAACDVFGQFYRAENERADTVDCTLNPGLFEPGEKHIVRVTPCNCFGGCGRPLETAFTAPPRDGRTTVVFDSDDPARECAFRYGLQGGEPVADERGWFKVSKGNNRLEFPSSVWEGTPSGTRYRFMVDMETEQTSRKTWTVLLRNPDPVRNANRRIATPPGRSGRMRYAFDFRKQGAGHAYYLLIREGWKGRVKFHRVRIERLGGTATDVRS